MQVTEIFKSIQGESTEQGFPCIFIRLSGCNLRCLWCDTKYAYKKGKEMSINKILEKIKSYGKIQLVEVTGGEPLLQKEVYNLSVKLLDIGCKVLIETNGSLPIQKLDKRVVRIIDIKCPGSGMSDKVYWGNMRSLRPEDEIKFVILDKEDYNWAKGIIKEYNLIEQAKILLQPVWGNYKLPLQIAEWILKDNLSVRLQIQLHKCIGIK